MKEAIMNSDGCCYIFLVANLLLLQSLHFLADPAFLDGSLHELPASGGPVKTEDTIIRVENGSELFQ